MRPGLVIVAMLAALTGPALSHSELRRSSPMNGAILSASPASVELVFNEKVQLTALRLFHEGKAEIRLDRPASIVDAGTATRALPALEAGAYRIDWRAISADGHPVGGVIRFRIGP